MAEVQEASLPTYPMARTCPFEPAPEYAQIRSVHPISRVNLAFGDPAWLITGHEAARQIMCSPKSSKNILLPGYPLMSPDQVKAVQGHRGLIAVMDPPEHTFFRRMLAGEFSIHASERLRPYIERIVAEHLDRMEAGDRPTDLVQAFSLPIPIMTICELLGVPYTRQPFFQLVSADATPEDRRANQLKLRAFMTEQIAAKLDDPPDDLLGRLIVRYREAGQTDLGMLTGLSLNIVLGGGRLSTTSLISLGALALMDHPDQRDEMLADPALVPGTVDELLRYFSVADVITHRIAVDDITIGDVTIRAGEGILLPNDAINRDPAAFEDPDEFDIHRNARHHLAFGAGIHQCVGQHLARLLLEIVYPALFSRFPGLSLAVPLDDVPFVYGAPPFSVAKLPVTW